MFISNNIIKHYLRNVYFITGTAYAGKSTMVKLLSERYDLLMFGENYHLETARTISTKELQPAHCYLREIQDFRDFVMRSPEEYRAWIKQSSAEAAEFEVLELMVKSRGKAAIVDTNIPLELLREIADPSHVAVMIAPKEMSVDRFFERDDPEKNYILSVIESTENPAWTKENFRKGLEEINSQQEIDRFKESGFFVLSREDHRGIQETCDLLAEHFGFKGGNHEPRTGD